MVVIPGTMILVTIAVLYLIAHVARLRDAVEKIRASAVALECIAARPAGQPAVECLTADAQAMYKTLWTIPVRDYAYDGDGKRVN
jgi:hypothetical protein